MNQPKAELGRKLLEPPHQFLGADGVGELHEPAAEGGQAETQHRREVDRVGRIGHAVFERAGGLVDHRQHEPPLD